jgi:glycosyltransferase involved in cell wall biosynthesis
MGLKIAMLTSWACRCGIASYSQNLAAALSKAGTDVYVVRVPRFGIPRTETFQNVIDSIPTKKIDLIHVQHEYGIWKGHEKTFYPSIKQLGLPIVTTMHSVGSWEVDGTIADKSDRIIVHNEFCFNRFGYPEKTGIIPHGTILINTPPPPEALCKKNMGIDPRVPLVGYVGYISPHKGLEMLIEAVAKIPKVALLIGGGWHLEEETEYTMNMKERTNKELPNRCQWLGYISDEHLEMVYGAMKVVVYPSRFITESGALLMAISHGKAVIASDLQPVREKAKQGALITFKNVSDLTRKIKHLIKNDLARQKLEEGARKYSVDNSWAKVAERHVKLYNEVLATKTHQEGAPAKSQEVH